MMSVAKIMRPAAEHLFYWAENQITVEVTLRHAKSLQGLWAGAVGARRRRVCPRVPGVCGSTCPPSTSRKRGLVPQPRWLQARRQIPVLLYYAAFAGELGAEGVTQLFSFISLPSPLQKDTFQLLQSGLFFSSRLYGNEDTICTAHS